MAIPSIPFHTSDTSVSSEELKLMQDFLNDCTSKDISVCSSCNHYIYGPFIISLHHCSKADTNRCNTNDEIISNTGRPNSCEVSQTIKDEDPAVNINIECTHNKSKMGKYNKMIKIESGYGFADSSLKGGIQAKKDVSGHQVVQMDKGSIDIDANSYNTDEEGGNSLDIDDSNNSTLMCSNKPQTGYPLSTRTSTASKLIVIIKQRPFIENAASTYIDAPFSEGGVEGGVVGSNVVVESSPAICEPEDHPDRKPATVLRDNHPAPAASHVGELAASRIMRADQQAGNNLAGADSIKDSKSMKDRRLYRAGTAKKVYVPLIVLKRNEDIGMTAADVGTTTPGQNLATGRQQGREKRFVCDVCGYVTVKPSNLIRHQRTHTQKKSCAGGTTETENTEKKKVYVCEVCGYSTNKSNNFNRHKTQHSAEKPHVCDVCGFACTQAVHLRDHKRQHTGERPHLCHICGYAATRATTLARHKRSKHARVRRFTCDVCGFATDRQATLRAHKRRHTGEKPYLCDMCDYTAAHASSLLRHKHKHTGEKPHVCKICGYAAAEKWRLADHHRYKHTDTKPYVCHICGYATALANSLRAHKRRHAPGGKPYKCDVCDYAAYEAGILAAHKRNHTGEKACICDICGARLSSEYKLMLHKRIHTGEKPYVCNICGYATAQAGNLVKHKVKHSDEKPYVCDVCGYAAARAIQLVVHKRKHTGEKPYVCEICGYTTAQAGNLSLHKAKHSKEESSGCDIFGYAAASQRRLVKRRRKHTRKNMNSDDVCTYD